MAYIDLNDLLEFGADGLIKEFMRRQFRAEGIDVDNWSRRSAAALCSATGTIIGSLMGGPLGFLLGALGWMTAYSASYNDDKPPGQIKREHRDVLKWKAIDIATRAIADNCTSDISERMSRAFYSASASIDEDYQIRPDEGADFVHRVMSRVDSRTAEQFWRLYQGALRMID